jgi:hypothetical protein
MKQTSNRRLRAARSADGLARLTAEFDRENVVDEFHALSPASRRRWANVKRKPGRPRKGRRVKVISLSVENPPRAIRRRGRSNTARARSSPRRCSRTVESTTS